jgi:hypothetical protein
MGKDIRTLYGYQKNKSQNKKTNDLKASRNEVDVILML